MFGVALVILPYFLRRQIGDKGAICAAVILTFSPTLLYFSRFGRNDILMVVWATLLLIFLWRYAESSKSRYLFGTAAVTALMLASKETAYFIILFMGLAALGLGWRELWAVARRRIALANARGAAGFFLLLATLTLPQAAAGISVLQGPLGLTLAAADTGSTGETGAPVWEAPFVSLPLWDAPVWMHVIGLLALLGAALGLAWFVWRARNALDLAAVAVAITCAVAAVSVVVVGPVQGLLNEPGTAGMYLDCAIGAALLVMGAAMGLVAPSALPGSRRVAALLAPSVILTWLWLAAFGRRTGPGVGAAASPPRRWRTLRQARVAVNYLAAGVSSTVAAGCRWSSRASLGAAVSGYCAQGCFTRSGRRCTRRSSPTGRESSRERGRAWAIGWRSRK